MIRSHSKLSPSNSCLEVHAGFIFRIGDLYQFLGHINPAAEVRKVRPFLSCNVDRFLILSIGFDPRFEASLGI